MDDISAAKDALNQLLDCYLVERNIQRTLLWVADDIYSLGTGSCEATKNKTEFTSLLVKEIINDPTPFAFEFKKMDAKSLGHGLVTFMGELLIRKILPGQDIIVITKRLTATMRRKKGVYQASVLHMSIASEIKEDQEFYPVSLGEKLLSKRRQSMRGDYYQLLNNSIPGGMMGGFIEDGFPLYFVNEQMLSYLGYTHEEFVSEIGGYVRNCIHPEDRDYVTGVVEACLSNSDEYEVTYRMLKKDKQFIWVADKGKRVLSEDGRPAIISVCIDITQSVLLQQALEAETRKLTEKNQELEHFYNTVFSGISKIVNDDNYTFLFANEHYYVMLGYAKESDETQCGNGCGLMRVHPNDRTHLIEILQSVNMSNRTFTHKLRLIKKDGAYLWVRIDGSLSRETYHGQQVFYFIYTDIDKQREQEIVLRKQQYFTSLVSTINTTGALIVYADEGYSFAYVGDNLINFMGYSKEEFAAQFRNYLEVCYPNDVVAMQASINEQLAGSDYYEVEYRVQKKDGSLIWVLEKGNKMIDEEGREILICILLDHSQQKQTKDLLFKASQLDPLTQIYNRKAARQEIEAYLAVAEADTYSALFLFDLDNFKLVNDFHGHMEGDNVLIEVASILSNSFRADDIVARLGGDEFIVFMQGITTETAAKKAQCICDIFSKKFHHHFTQAELTVSVGVALTLEKKITFQQLYQAADTALYQAKCNGKNAYEVAYPVLDDEQKNLV